MYKLFLCLRYLRRRVIAYFAMIGVALCVAMMLIVVSVMNGFLHKIEIAAKGLFGDIVIDSGSAKGMSRYDEFLDYLQREVPEVQAGSPFILTYGILTLPGTTHQQGVQIAGIRLPERAAVSDFAQGLHFEKGMAPTFDPPPEVLIAGLEREIRYTQDIARQLEEGDMSAWPPEKQRLWDSVMFALMGQREALSRIKNAPSVQKELDELKAKVQDARDRKQDAQADELEKQFRRLQRGAIRGPDDRVVLGLGLQSLSFRTPSGQTLRAVVPGDSITLTFVPLGKRLSLADIAPTDRTFTIVDDCKTGVSSIDSGIVYIPFETLQSLNNMAPADGAATNPAAARCGQLHLKVRDDCSATERQLEQVCAKVQRAWAQFEREHPDAAERGISIETWRQRQAPLVSQIESQRTLVVIMFGVISLVAVALVFVLFYTIVVQKTKDIGVLKAIGASSGGVAGIFLAYGAAIGLAGSAVGTVIGYVFVLNINPIHDWIGRTFGFTVWNREWFMFDKIPNEVELVPALVIVAGAVLAGLAGSLLPAALAARMQPVEALRYE